MLLKKSGKACKGSSAISSDFAERELEKSTSVSAPCRRDAPAVFSVSPRPASIGPAVALASAFLAPDSAWAHASDRGFVLLLPTGHYLFGGALAVGATFGLLAFLSAERLARLAAWRRRLFSLPLGWRELSSWLCFGGLVCLLLAGLAGSRDPLDNPLPLSFWTIFWIGLPLAQSLSGDLWSRLDPWAGPCRLARRLGWRKRARLPPWIGAFPAVFLLCAFIWFELVYPAPEDPLRLAVVLAAYWAGTFLLMLLFGHRDWGRRGEIFTVLFGMLARLSPFEGCERGGRCHVCLCLPGAKLLRIRPLRPGLTAFLILALAGVSFDGLAKTFFYLGVFGVNPLEYPGRSALAGLNTAGLLAAFAALAAAFFGSLALGRLLAGSPGGSRTEAGLLVASLLPIALAYQFAHYLTALLVNGQYWLVSLSDPFGRGWNLFGTAHLPVRAAIAAGSDAAWFVWNAQAAAIIGGHLLAVALAHGLAQRIFPETRRVLLFLVPLTALMIAYTVFGLWLLSTPTGV